MNAEKPMSNSQLQAELLEQHIYHREVKRKMLMALGYAQGLLLRLDQDGKLEPDEYRTFNDLHYEALQKP